MAGVGGASGSSSSASSGGSASSSAGKNDNSSTSSGSDKSDSKSSKGSEKSSFDGAMSKAEKNSRSKTDRNDNDKNKADTNSATNHTTSTQSRPSTHGNEFSGHSGAASMNSHRGYGPDDRPPAKDAPHNQRSTSPAPDRLNTTQNYGLNESRNAAAENPGLTPAQSRSLADSAAVMEGAVSNPTGPTSQPPSGLDAIAAERGKNLLGQPSSFDDTNQIQVADAGSNSGFLSDVGQAIKDDYEGSMVQGVVNFVRDDFKGSIIGNALTDRENLSLEFKADSVFGGATLTLSDKDNDGEIEFNTEASAKGRFGSINFDPGDELDFTVESPNTVSQFNNDGSGSFTAKGKNFSGSITGDGDITIDANGEVPVTPLSRVTAGATRTMPSDGGPITVDARAGVEVGVPGVATLSAEVKARDIFDANDPEMPDQPVDTPAPVTGPIDQIAEIEQPDIARHIAEKKEREREQAEAEAGASGSSRSQDSLEIETKEPRFLGF